MKAALLQAAAKHPDKSPLDLLRLAVFGLDSDMAALARKALAGSSSIEAARLIGEALQAPTDPAERNTLIDTLEKIGATSPEARRIAVVHRGLATESGTVDVSRWAEATKSGGTSTWRTPADARAAYEKSAEASDSQALTPDALLTRAETALALALEMPARYPSNPRKAHFYARRLYGDARRFRRQSRVDGGP